MNFKTDITGALIKTERLVLREWRQTDLNDFFEYASVDGVGQMAGWAPHENIEVSRQILNLFINEKKTFCIEFCGKAIGSVGIEPYEEKDYPELSNLQGREIGYVLSKDYWGRGIMPEAVKAVCAYCFKTLKADFLLCGYFTFNKQSARVQQKCGFKYLKTLPRKTRIGTVEQTVMNVLYAKDFFALVGETEKI